MILGKSAKLNEAEKFNIGCCFYGTAGLLYGGATVLNYDLTFIEGIFAFIGMVLFWPFTLGIMEYNQPNGAGLITDGVILASFIITQLIAVIMVIKRANRETDDL